MTSLPTMQLLLCDTADNAAEALLGALGRARLSVAARRVSGKSALYDALGSGCWDVLLINEKVVEVDIGECAALVRERRADTAVVVLSAEPVSAGALLRCFRRGAAALVSLDALDYSVTVIGREFVSVRNRRRLHDLAAENAELAQRCRLLLQSSNEAIAYVHEGMHIHANQSYLTLFGFDDMDELAGSPFVDMVRDDCREALKASLRNVQSSGATTTTLWARRTGGAHFEARLAISPTRYGGEHCLQVVVGKPASRSEVSAPRVEDIEPSPEAITPSPEPATKSAPLPERAAVIPLECERKAEPASAPGERRGGLRCEPVIAVSDMEPEFYALESHTEDGGRLPADSASGSTPLAQKLDQWRLQEAAALLARRAKRGEHLQLLTELGGYSACDRRFMEWLASLLASHGLDAQALVLALRQEDVMADRERMLAAAAHLQRSGLRLCVSGFDASPPMLDFIEAARVRLVRLAPDATRRVQDDGDYAAELRDRIARLHERGVKVIASRVDDTTALSALWKADVDFVQGALLPDLELDEGVGHSQPAAAEGVTPLTRQA